MGRFVKELRKAEWLARVGVGEESRGLEHRGTEGQEEAAEAREQGGVGGRQKERGDTQSVAEVGRLKDRHPRD